MWSSGTVQDSGSLDLSLSPASANVCVSLGKIVSIALLTWVHHGGIGHGKYYNLRTDKLCTWPVAPLGEAK